MLIKIYTKHYMFWTCYCITHSIQGVVGVQQSYDAHSQSPYTVSFILTDQFGYLQSFTFPFYVAWLCFYDFYNRGE